MGASINANKPTQLIFVMKEKLKKTQEVAKVIDDGLCLQDSASIIHNPDGLAD